MAKRKSNKKRVKCAGFVLGLSLEEALPHLQKFPRYKRLLAKAGDDRTEQEKIHSMAESEFIAVDSTIRNTK